MQKHIEHATFKIKAQELNDNERVYLVLEQAYGKALSHISQKLEIDIEHFKNMQEIHKGNKSKVIIHVFRFFT